MSSATLGWHSAHKLPDTADAVATRVEPFQQGEWSGHTAMSFASLLLPRASTPSNLQQAIADNEPSPDLGDEVDSEKSQKEDFGLKPL